MNIYIASLLISLVCINAVSSKDYFRGCYYTNWSQYRTGIWRYIPEHYEIGLCSHLFYAFVSMGDDFKLKTIEKNDLNLYVRFNNLKNIQTDLRTILSFGGYVVSQANSARLSLMRKMLSTVENCRRFINGAIEFVRFHNFDGLDLNWFPVADTKDNFVLLVEEMRAAMEIEAVLVDKPRLILTIAVPSEIDRIRAGYNGTLLAESVDYLNVMSFDYHGAWENTTGFNTPLYDRDGDGISINSTFAYLINEQQVPRKKLVMGYASYGRGWTIPGMSIPNRIILGNRQPNQTSLATGPSPAQPFTLAEGVAAYFEICSLVEEGYDVDFDREQRVVYAHKTTPAGGIWIAFDNVRSFDEGLDWLIDNELAGAFVWTLDMDDFIGHCASSEGIYPLIKAIKKKLTA